MCRDTVQQMPMRNYDVLSSSVLALQGLKRGERGEIRRERGIRSQ